MSEQGTNMETHVQIVGILSLVWGAIALFGGLMMSLFTGLAFFPMGGMGGMGSMGGFEAGIMGLMFTVMLVLAVLAIATGVGLLKHRSWARTLGFVVAALSLFSFPIGTAFGIYAFWVLTRPETERLLERGPAAARA